MLERFLSAVFDEQHQFKDLWELKLIKFDIDIDEDLKPYEKHLAVSSLVEDVKGNPGQKGNFFLTNLRLIWHGIQDKDLNLSIGLDTITYVNLKSYPQQGFHDLKHVLTVKALSPGQTKYEFKFAGFRPAEEKMFKKVEDVFRKFSQTKYFRNLDTGPKLTSGEYKPLEGEQFKTKYEECTFVENMRSKPVTLILTDIRLLIIHHIFGTTNYGIPWIMLERFVKTDYNNKEALELHIRGILKDVELYISCANRGDFSKMHKEIVSFSQTYNKNPTLGLDFSNLQDSSDPVSAKFVQKLEISQFEQTKVNIGRRKNPYGDKNQKGSIKQTFFNDELGIMMQKMPEGCTRNDLWSILKP